MKALRAIIGLVFGNTGLDIYDEIKSRKCPHEHTMFVKVCMECGHEWEQ